jgi:predicted dehydrogenase
MPDINVALIGYAFMGRAHSNAYRQVAPFFFPTLTPRMKVICGRTRDKVEHVARQFGWEEAATDWREVIARPDIQLVDIVTSVDTHAEMAIAAAEAGKAVFCEKPLARSVAEAEAMAIAARKAGVTNMVCHNYRRAPAVTLARQLIEEGKLGTIRHFRGTYLQEWLVNPDFPRTWRLDREKAGAGTLGDLGSHVIDLARYLVGEITEVTGTTETFIKERPLADDPSRKAPVTVDDAAAAVVRFANGALGTFEMTRYAPGRKNHNRFEINGSLGSLGFNLERMNELELYLNTEPGAIRGFHTILVTDREHHPYVKAWWPPGHIIGYEHTFTHTVYDLLEAIAKGAQVAPSFEDGLRNQRVIDAIARAAATKAWVSV